MAFYVGQKVVCVDDSPGLISGERLIKGHIYTVLETGSKTTVLKIPAILVDDHTGFGWAAKRFRPVVERKTDISIFTEMLTPNKRELVRN